MVSLVGDRVKTVFVSVYFMEKKIYLQENDRSELYDFCHVGVLASLNCLANMVTML